jgi:hypothetical protein
VPKAALQGEMSGSERVKEHREHGGDEGVFLTSSAIGSKEAVGED